MKSFYQYITEVFDQTYPYQRKLNLNSVVGYNFETKDEKSGVITFTKSERNSQEWDAEFTINGSIDITRGGDAFSIFGTVIKVIDEFLKNYKPGILTFTAMKDINDKESRIDLYRKMLQRMANKTGYSFEETKKDIKSVFIMKMMSKL